MAVAAQSRDIVVSVGMYFQDQLIVGAAAVIGVPDYNLDKFAIAGLAVPEGAATSGKFGGNVCKAGQRAERQDEEGDEKNSSESHGAPFEKGRFDGRKIA
ncbi:hypothetical protein [Devosia sp.]|uniref:hypothetical protein n=1 Tax=Devosia sp. TaxID=1871048 RepID=UPI00263065B2|nr:hypothetical protein [Devosia sp.]